MALRILASSVKTAAHREHEQKMGQNHIDEVMAYMPWKIEALTLACKRDGLLDADAEKNCERGAPI